MSKKSIHDCIKEYEKTAFTVSRSEAMQFTWNFCASQYDSENASLKSELEQLKKENLELKEYKAMNEGLYK